MPEAFSIEELTVLQFAHASHDQRELPPAVALKQMMHKSRSRETSHPSHFSGESSSRHDCHRIGKVG
jgi:hypothetical protein